MNYTLLEDRADRRPTASRPELLKANDDLQTRNAERTRWLLNAAHDLRNQVYAVLANAELLQEELPKKNQIVESIHDSAEAMLHLLSDLTEITSVDSGISPFGFAPTALLPVIKESIALCLPAAEKKNTTLELTCQQSGPIMNIDVEKIREVFVNLIGNAIKYSQNFARVEVEIISRGDQVLISVRDNGPGIPPDELKSIFTPFLRTRARAVSPDPGTGLGLAICKRIVERHGGRIWAESKPGQGAEFHVVLSCRAGRSGARRPSELAETEGKDQS